MEIVSLHGIQWDIAFTQTFSKIHTHKPLSQFNETAPHLCKTLGRMGVLYVIFPEFRLLTGDIHYHGVLKVIDKVRYQKNRYELKRYGYTCFKFIDNIDKWISYITKDYEVNQKTLGTSHITRENYDQYESQIMKMKAEKALSDAKLKMQMADKLKISNEEMHELDELIDVLQKETEALRSPTETVGNIECDERHPQGTGRRLPPYGATQSVGRMLEYGIVES